MKVLFIGGTGIISSACSELAVKNGVDLYHLNRGQSKSVRAVDGVKTLIADIRNVDETKKALEGHQFDAVVDWIAFEPEHVENDIKLFKDITKQFVFISSASSYQTPPEKLPVTEDTPLDNPFWEYSRNKIACENILFEAYKNDNFPCTIVRPSHTYDKTIITLVGETTAFKRLLDGKKIVVHGDGSSIWTLTHHKDFAKGLVGLLGKQEAVGEAFHITSNELLSWDIIIKTIAKHISVEPKMVHVASDVIAEYDDELGANLLGDKSHSMIFDNSKLKKIVPEFECTIPFSEGCKDFINWHMEDRSRIVVDEELDAVFDDIIKKYDLEK